MTQLLSTFTPASVALIISFFGIVVWWIRGMPARELAAIERIKAQAINDASLRTDLMARVSELEQQILDDRKFCDAKIRDMQQRFDGVIRQFITYQLTVAQAIPPEQRGQHTAAMLETLQPLLVHSYPEPSESASEAPTRAAKR